MSNRKITILGGGQAGLQLACGLLQKGYEVKLVQNRTADEIHTGRVMSSQCMFGAALQNERDVGLDFWANECPTVDSINFVVPGCEVFALAITGLPAAMAAAKSPPAMLLKANGKLLGPNTHTGPSAA